MQQTGNMKISLTCPKALQAYDEYMGYINLVDFDKNWWIVYLKMHQEMVQERISWNIGFHVGKWSCCMKYVSKIEKSFQDDGRQFKMENVSSQIYVKLERPNG